MKLIPATLEQAVDWLISQMDAATKTHWLSHTLEESTVPIHHGGGTNMRNDWGLWHGKTPISRWLREHRIWHGDDASATIFEATWRKLHDLPIDDAWVAERAAFYEAFWNRSGVTWDQKRIPGFVPKATRWFRVGERGAPIEEDEP